MSNNRPYEMTISLNVLKHLGIGLYSNAPAVIAEAVANAWDADAKNVEIQIDQNSNQITVTDDGHGMTLADINEKYLLVGYERRENKDGHITPEHKRPVMGRKGIGKLSLFSIADVIEVHTVKDDEKNAFKMIVQDIIKCAEKGDAYYPLSVNIDNINIEKGTQLIISNLRKQLAQTPAALKKRVARRFSIIGAKNKFNVKINNDPISIEDRGYFYKVQYLWMFGTESSFYSDYCSNKEKHEIRSNKIEVEEVIDGKSEKTTHQIKGWIGSVKNSGDLKDGEDNINKIILIVRGKLAQEDILEDFSEGGLYTKYLIGEINADFFDMDDKEDSATSSRQEIKKDDPRYLALQAFVGKELKYIQSLWTQYRIEGGTKEALKYTAIKEWFKRLSSDSQKRAQSLFGKINQLTIDSEEEKRRLYKHSILAFESLRYKENLDALEKITPEKLDVFSKIIIDLDDIEASLYYQITKERIQIIEALIEKVDENVLEKIIQQHLFDHLWLLDPTWERATETPYMERAVTEEFEKINAKLSVEEASGRLDIKYKTSSRKHIIIELKKADRRVSSTELITQISKYRSALIKLLKNAGQENEPVEVVCVVGRELKDWSEPNGREESEKMLAAKGTRTVLYAELIQNAYKAYKAYVEKKKEAGKVYELIRSIDESDIISDS